MHSARITGCRAGVQCVAQRDEACHVDALGAVARIDTDREHQFRPAYPGQRVAQRLAALAEGGFHQLREHRAVVYADLRRRARQHPYHRRVHLGYACSITERRP